jgi:hypothetical protein
MAAAAKVTTSTLKNGTIPLNSSELQDVYG